MACNILSRLFRRRNRQLPVSADRPSPPALPTHTDKLQLEQSLVQLDLVDNLNQEHDRLFLLDCLSEQGSYTLTLPNIPFGTDNTHIQCVQSLPGFIGLEGGISESPSIGIDVLVHFSTAADAAHAMASQPAIILGSGSSRRLQHDNRSTDTPERASKRQKTELSEPSESLPSCSLCCEVLIGRYARPCLCCDAMWCYTCLETNFSTALSDHERFPVKCCGKIVHFDVGKGVLAAADYSKYKTRFEEHGTTKPVYCGNPTCSEFLPARLSNPDDKGRVHCFSCQKVTCVDCRVLVHPGDTETHTCTEADEMTALMTQFEYKRCPRCNTGVAKMYGCSHVRCQCGAHWCWDCERAIQICWSKPCERAREDGDMTDDYDLPAEESESDDEPASETPTVNQVQQPPSTEVTSTEVSDPNTAPAAEVHAVGGLENAELVPVLAQQLGMESGSAEMGISRPLQLPQVQRPQSDDAMLSTPETIMAPVIVDEGLPTLPRPQPLEYRPPAVLAATPLIPAVHRVPEIGEPLVNLDADDQDDWEAGDFDFGDEPTDESWDTWGCLHHFELLQSSKMHQYWLPATHDPQSRQITNHIDCLRCYKTITIAIPSAEPKKDDERKDSGVDISLETRSTEIANTAEEPEKNVKKKRKGKKQGDASKLFNCRRCGVVYCIACKKATMKELKVILERNTFRGY